MRREWQRREEIGVPLIYSKQCNTTPLNHNDPMTGTLTFGNTWLGNAPRLQKEGRKDGWKEGRPWSVRKTLVCPLFLSSCFSTICSGNWVCGRRAARQKAGTEQKILREAVQTVPLLLHPTLESLEFFPEAERIQKAPQALLLSSRSPVRPLCQPYPRHGPGGAINPRRPSAAARPLVGCLRFWGFGGGFGGVLGGFWVFFFRVFLGCFFFFFLGGGGGVGRFLGFWGVVLEALGILGVLGVWVFWRFWGFCGFGGFGGLGGFGGFGVLGFRAAPPPPKFERWSRDFGDCRLMCAPL